MTLRDKLFGFEGRLRRRDYWMLLILLIFLTVVISQPTALLVGGPDATLFFRHRPHPPVNYHNWSVQTLVMMATALVVTWPSLALIVKRRHDRGASGKLAVALQFLGLALTYFPTAALFAGPVVVKVNSLLSAVNFVVGMWFLVVLGILDGTPGPNRYGPSPKGIGDLVEVFD